MIDRSIGSKAGKLAREAGTFHETYSDVYDSLYRDKDYEAECDLIEETFRRFASNPPKSILDLGCGTGGHAIPLATRGYDVTGVDRSEAMLSQATAKAARLGLTTAAFSAGDIRHLNLNRQFDAALMMFAVLGYQLENDDVLAALCAARSHLRQGGLLVFDVWYGPAVLHERPSDRVKLLSTPGSERRVLRASSGALDVRKHVCTVDFHVWQIDGERIVSETEERHVMRFFFPMELELLLGSSGFALIHLSDFASLDRQPGEGTWNILATAKAI